MALYMNLAAAISHNACAFVSRTATSTRSQTFSNAGSRLSRFMTSSSSSSTSSAGFGVSRIDTLQTLLNKAGAPGSQGCSQPNDLVPVETNGDDDKMLQLHPHLYPIAQSQSNPDHYICALRRAYADDAMYESSTNAPWPIVETTLNGPGYRLLSLNSEHIMRRIAAHADDSEGSDAADIMNLYNQDLGKGLDVVDPAFDNLYDEGSVAKLGYGASKYILLRVGPFPDLYEEMAISHSNRNDESSSLIAAEASNGKFTGFASTFKFYAELLTSFPNREDEARDAARVCLRLPLPSIGMYDEDFVRLSHMARLCTEGDDAKVAMAKIEEMYEKIKKHEQEEEQSKSSMTPEQMAIEDANAILDRMVFVEKGERDWSSVRKELGEIYAAADLDDMADFVDPSRQG